MGEVFVVGVEVVAVIDPGVVGVVAARGPNVGTAVLVFLLSCSLLYMTAEVL